MNGPNVVVTRDRPAPRHPARLAQAAAHWRPQFEHLRRPFVAVLIGGSNGRFRLDASVGRELAGQLAAMMGRDGVGVAVTPSRRTDPAVTRVLTEALAPLGGYVWDGRGDNPYFGMLALADAIVVTVDSVSMVSEAVATEAPVLLAALPGRSRRNRLFIEALLAEGRGRAFGGSYENWQVSQLTIRRRRRPRCAAARYLGQVHVAHQTFDNRAGGNVLYKALAHPLAGRRSGGCMGACVGPVALADPDSIAKALLRCIRTHRVAGLYVHDMTAVGSGSAGYVFELTDLPASGARIVLIAAFDAARIAARISWCPRCRCRALDDKLRPNC
jgi:hypothetical protein